MNIIYNLIIILCLLQLVISLRIIAKPTIGKYVSISNRLIDKTTTTTTTTTTTLQSGNGEAGYKKWSCISCAYVYDEAKGFKKRIPPGTRFESMNTFACPVCGAAKNQFIEVKE